MSLARLMNQPLTVQAVGPATLDAYGNSVPGSLGLPVAEFGYLEQVDTIEFVLDRQTTVSHWAAFLFAESVVTPMAYINFQGQRWQVNGEPWHVYNPRTRAVSHIKCKLVVVT
jgi:hypothetical protein